jgi:hypothetical protein
MDGSGSGPAPAAWVLEMEDELFRQDSAVFMPDALDETPGDAPVEGEPPRVTGLEGLKVVFLFLAEHPDRRMLITGHSDTVGEMRYNRDLSLKRARSVELHLVGGQDSRETWAKDIVQRKHHPKDIQHILKWASDKFAWDTDPGDVDGRHGPRTQKALLDFHKRCNEELGLDLPVHGQVTVDTWRGVFELYQDALQMLLDADDEDMERFHRKQLRWVHPIRHVDGCGESWPADASRKRTNRRVEILFFDKNENPVFKSDPCQKETCPIYGGTARRQPLPPHLGTRPLTRPTFSAPEAPGSGTSIPLDGLWGYVVNFNKRGALTSVTGWPFKNGKLVNGSGTPVDIEGDRSSYLYVSHRKDLANLARDSWFKADRSGLPLLGPIAIPCGEDARVDLNIWDQKDWIIVQPHPTEGKPDGAMLVEWSEDYWVGEIFYTERDLEGGNPNGSPVAKELQEHWLDENGGGRPCVGDPPAAPLDRIPSANLVLFGRAGGVPAYVGTLSALPVGGTAQHPPPRSSGRRPETPEAGRGSKGKVLLLFQATPSEKHTVTSFNEVVRTAANAVVSHHTYDGPTVDVLTRLNDNPGKEELDALLKRYSAPARALLPGDTCWASQRQTEHCASFSMAAAMNYWYPRTNNPWRANGEAWFKRIDQLPFDQGATPRAVVEAADTWQMHARFRSGKELDRDRGEKLLKLWLWAGVPVIVNIVESGPPGLGGTSKNRHFKLVVGYDGDRFFFQNSGLDWERHMGLTEPLRHAPVGNDVDLRSAFHDKWEATTEGIIGAFLSPFTSARTFIPVYPKDSRFRGTSAT